MNRHAIDRWTDTTAFRVALCLSGAVVLPVLALGVLTTVVGGAALLRARVAVEIEQIVFGLLAGGGLLGLVGYVRAHGGARRPDRHNVTATLLCLAAGVVTALAVAGYAGFGALDLVQSLWSSPLWVALAAGFAAANVVWAAAGIAWMQRLPRRYAENTGRAFDGLPVVLLFVAIALVIAAALKTIAL